MIVIWDNGGCYSNHEIGFFDIGDLSIEEVDAALKLTTRDDGKIIGSAEAIEWREPSATGSFTSQFWNAPEFVEREGHLTLSAAVLRALLPRFVERVAEWDDRLSKPMPKGCENWWPDAARSEREALTRIIVTCRERFPGEQWPAVPA